MDIKLLFSNRRVVVSLAITVIVAAIAIGGTMAYFSDTETSVGNKFVAGKFNLKIDNTCHYNGKECVMVEPGYYTWTGTNEQCFCTWEAKDLTNELFFNLGDVKPGDFGEDTISLHIDNNDAWICAELTNLKNNDNGCENPEYKAETSAYGAGHETCGIPGLGQGELQSNLLFSIWKDNGAGEGHACNNIKDTDETYIFENQPAEEEAWAIADSTTGAPIPGGTTICYGVAWSLPIGVNNIIQTDDFSEDVIFTAVQARNMDSFKCSDLYTEVCGDGIDNNYDGNIDENCGCTSNEQCNDGIYCNGLETCNAQHVCVSPGSPCPGQNVGPNCNDSCNEASDSCTANDSDGTSCTGGSCQSGTCAMSCVPIAEVCNGLDDDCDGVVDEGNPGGGGSCNTGLQGVCSSGITQCTGGALSCVQNLLPTTEICDGLDNDCDGVVDEGNICWISPTSNNDAGWWRDDANGRDGDQYSTTVTDWMTLGTWTDTLSYYVSPAVPSNKLRFYSTGNWGSNIEIRATVDGISQLVYSGDNSYAWKEISLSPTGVVSQIDIRGTNAYCSGACTVGTHLGEIQVLRTP